MKKKKILLDPADLNKVIKKIKVKEKKIVLCHGVFDLFHLGHLRYFEASKKLGDILIVSITDDEYVNKGPGRPIFKNFERLKLLEALEIIDFVVLSKSITAEKMIKIIKPDFYCKGPEYKKGRNDITLNIYKEKNLVNKYGGKIHYINEETLSSTKIINRNFLNDLDPDILSFKKELNKISNLDRDVKKIDNFKKLKILIIGESIIDNYIFCDAIGKSGKEPHLVLKDNKSEMYMGGVIAIAKNLETFCKNITVVSSLGSDFKKHQNRIKKSLTKNIYFKFFEKKNSPTIIKKRFIDNLSKYKLLGIYSFDDRELDKKEEYNFEKLIYQNINKYDLILISDYGHGLISKNIANKLCSKFSNKIFLNAQLNSGNYGYHSLLKYKKVNSLIINENELRHEVKDKHSKIENLIKKFTKILNFKNILITRGARGSIYFEKEKKKFYYCPALASTVIDKVGAGDAMLSMASISIKNKIHPLKILLNSSIAASTVVSGVGNSKSINKKYFIKSLLHFSK